MKAKKMMAREHGRRCASGSAAALLLLLAAGPGESQTHTPRVLLLPPQTAGRIPHRDRWLAEFDERVTAALGARAQVIRSAKDEPTCADPTCLAQLATKYGVDAIVLPKAGLDRQTPPDYHLSVRLFNRDDGKTLEVEQLCRGCGEKQAGLALASLAATLRPHGPVSAVASLEPARTSAAESPRIAEPAPRIADPSPRIADPAPRIAQPSPRVAQPAPRVAAAPASSSQSPAMPPFSRRQRSAMSPAALMGLSVATALVAVGGLLITGIGGALLSADGKPTCSSGPANQCPTLFDTQGQGGAMVAVGLVAVVGAAVALGFELRALHRAKRRYSLAPSFDSTRIGLSLGGTW